MKKYAVDLTMQFPYWFDSLLTMVFTEVTRKRES